MAKKKRTVVKAVVEMVGEHITLSAEAGKVNDRFTGIAFGVVTEDGVVLPCTLSLDIYGPVANGYGGEYTDEMDSLLKGFRTRLIEDFGAEFEDQPTNDKED